MHGDIVGQRFRANEAAKAASDQVQAQRQADELARLVEQQAADMATDRVYDLSDAERLAEESPDWGVRHG
jgi:hypothetical protein